MVERSGVLTRSQQDNSNRTFENDSLIVLKQIGIAVSERLQKE